MVPAVLVAVQVYTPSFSLWTGENMRTPRKEGRTRPSNIHMMVGAGSPEAVQAMECCVFSRTVALPASVIEGGTACTMLELDHVTIM